MRSLAFDTHYTQRSGPDNYEFIDSPLRDYIYTYTEYGLQVQPPTKTDATYYEVDVPIMRQPVFNMGHPNGLFQLMRVHPYGRVFN